jgi:hypothetical protein
MDTIANDCANLFGVVTKLSIPIIDMPLVFTVTWWASEEEMKNSVYHSEIEPYMIETIWFNLDVANAYDTRFFGHETRKPYTGVSWIEFKKKYQGIEWHRPKQVSLSRYLHNRLVNISFKTSLFTENFMNKLRSEDSYDKGRFLLLDCKNPYVRYIRSHFVWLYWSFRTWYYLEFLHTLYQLKKQKYK